MADYCENCNHTGLLPFVKDGKVIPFVWIDCDCRGKLQYQENYHTLTPDMFDFSCSPDFRASQFNVCGVFDPGLMDTIQEVRREQEITSPKFATSKDLRKPVTQPDKKRAEISGEKLRKTTRKHRVVDL